MMTAYKSRKVTLSLFTLGLVIGVLVLNRVKQYGQAINQQYGETLKQHRQTEATQYAGHTEVKQLHKTYHDYSNYNSTQTLSNNLTKKSGRRVFGLSMDAIQKVETLVLFTGYPRSGHSIIGSMMNAHPHMAIGHNFILFKDWDLYKKKGYLQDKIKLFRALYAHSMSFVADNDVTGNKGYSLRIDYPWWGTYDDVLQVIGDRSAGISTVAYMQNETLFEQRYKQLLRIVNIPVKIIHVVRNPFDLISTATLYMAGKQQAKQTNVSMSDFVKIYKSLSLNLTAMMKFNNISLLEYRTELLFKMADAVSRMITIYGPENVLEIHHSDFVMDPKQTLRKMCSFLQLQCPAAYLQACADKTFKTLSKTRDVVLWPPRLRHMVDERVKNYTFFQRYSFDRDY